MQKIYKNFVFTLFLTVIFWSSCFLSVRAQSVVQTTAPLVVTTPKATITPTPIPALVVPSSFIVPLNSTLDQVAQSLVDQNYIKNKIDFTAVFSVTKGDILPGGYKLIT